MSFDPELLIDRPAFDDLFVSEGIRSVEEVTPDLENLGEQVSETVKAEGVTVSLAASLEGVETAFHGNGKSVRVMVESGGRSVDLASAVRDPTIPVDDVVNGINNAAKEVGLSLPETNLNELRSQVASNPVRNITESVDRTASDQQKYESDSSLSTNSPEVKALDAAYDNPNTDPATKAANAQAINEALANDPTIKDLQSKLNEVSEKVPQKTWMDYLEKAGAWTVKGLALLIGGTLTYELLKAYQNELKGCWQAKSDGKTVTKIKIQSLTCDSCCSSTGDYQPSPDTRCDPAHPPSGAPCTCQPTPCMSGPSVDCTCGNTCTGETNPGLCSTWCSNGARILSGEGNTTYSYACNNPSLTDTIADIASNVDDVISNLISGAAGFLQSLLKWGGYILLAVAAILLLYFGFKFIGGLLTGHSAPPAQSSTNSSKQ